MIMVETPENIFAPDSPYRRLSRSLDGLPNRFPPASNGSDLRLLAKLFTPEEAELAAELLPDVEPPGEIARRLGRVPAPTLAILKEMSQKGLITFGKTSQGRPGFGLRPFVVGIYEAHLDRMDAELARLFEDYFQKAFGRALEVQPLVHRVIPLGVSVKSNLAVRPFESVSTLIDNAQAWGVLDCICRVQKALIGQPCNHPVDVCMALSSTPDAFAGGTVVRPLTRAEAYQTLKRAAEAGLVHCVSNNQRDTWYICNCCTCSCGVLRGMKELGIANVVAHSGFINQVEEDLCTACGLCVSNCQFEALSLEDTARVAEIRCAGCGVCVQFCPEGALGLVARLETSEPPQDEAAWRVLRQNSRATTPF